MFGNVPSKVKDLIFTHTRTVHISESSFENAYILCLSHAQERLEMQMKMKRRDPFFGRGFSKNGAFKGRCIFFTLENVLNIYGFISVVCDVVG